MEAWVWFFASWRNFLTTCLHLLIFYRKRFAQKTFDTVVLSILISKLLRSFFNGKAFHSAFSFRFNKIWGFFDLAVRAGMFFCWYGDRGRERAREGLCELSFFGSSSPFSTPTIVNTATPPHLEWVALHGVQSSSELSVLLSSTTTTTFREMCSVGFTWFTVDCCFAG